MTTTLLIYGFGRHKPLKEGHELLQLWVVDGGGLAELGPVRELTPIVQGVLVKELQIIGQ